MNTTNKMRLRLNLKKRVIPIMFLRKSTSEHYSDVKLFHKSGPVNKQPTY
jgi:hypothetical protein